MNDKAPQERYLEWTFMTPMEQSVWGTTVALHSSESDGGISAADALIDTLRSLGATRSQRLEPECEAAKANVNIERDEFAVWYPIAYRLQHRYDRHHVSLKPDDIEAVYERYARGRCDYW